MEFFVVVSVCLAVLVVTGRHIVQEFRRGVDALHQLARASARHTIGQHDLDEVLQQFHRTDAFLRETVATSTQRRGVDLARFGMKDAGRARAMQRLMAMQAEAMREKRARLLKADADCEASAKLAAASAQRAENPAALEPCRTDMIAEVGTEPGSTLVIMVPSDFVTLPGTLDHHVREHAASTPRAWV